MWVAHKRGAIFPESELDKFDFIEQVNKLWSESDFVLVAPTPHGSIPVGMVSFIGDTYKVEPDILWLPWASPRNKAESWGHILNEVRREHLGIIHAREEDIHFFWRMKDYGLIRNSGKIRHYFGRGKDTQVFYSKVD